VEGRDGRPVTAVRAALRTLPGAAVVVAPFGVVQLVALAIYVAPLALPGRRTLADHVAGTRVVRACDEPDAARPRPPFAPRHRLAVMPSQLERGTRR